MNFPRPSLCLRPKLRIDGQRTHLSCLRVEKGAVVGQLTIAKELGKHGKSARCESLIDERLLSVQCLNRRAAWQRIFASISVDDLRVEFADRSQAVCLPAIARIERLAKNILSAGRIVTQIDLIIG